MMYTRYTMCILWDISVYYQDYYWDISVQHQDIAYVLLGIFFKLYVCEVDPNIPT